MDLRSKLELYKTNRDNNSNPDKAALDKVHLDKTSLDEAPLNNAALDKEGTSSMEVKSGCDVQDLLPGTLCTSDMGTYFLIKNEYPLCHIHGSCRLKDALKIGNMVLRKFCSDFPETISVKDFLFLDTETTGLSGGAGTVAFLVGAGYFDKTGFVVRQYFMRDYNEETPMLQDFNNFIKGFKGIVTFNGKSFDWNLLETRFIFNRTRCSLKEPYHIDLLHPSRRLWKFKLESCSLSSIEQHILGQERHNDIPGALIPSVYFKYVEDRDAHEIQRVIKHNEMDILSMISLLVKIASMLEKPSSQNIGGYELLGLGSMFEAVGEQPIVMECYERCMSSESAVVRNVASKRLGLLYKKKRDYENAVKYWYNMLDREESLDIDPFVELAKYYEHRAVDYARAAELTERAMKRILSLGIRNGRNFEELKKRLDRLKRKAGRISNE